MCYADPVGCRQKPEGPQVISCSDWRDEQKDARLGRSRRLRGAHTLDYAFVVNHHNCSKRPTGG